MDCAKAIDKDLFDKILRRQLRNGLVKIEDEDTINAKILQQPHLGAQRRYHKGGVVRPEKAARMWLGRHHA